MTKRCQDWNGCFTATPLTVHGKDDSTNLSNRAAENFAPAPEADLLALDLPNQFRLDGPTKSPPTKLLPNINMSQLHLHEGAMEQQKLPKLLLPGESRLNDQQRYYIVVALSQRKQSNIMEAIGHSHSQNQPFPTWNLVSQVLSEALFAQPSSLQLKSTMELHHKDYLLFEHGLDSGAAADPAIIAESVLEVDFGRQLDYRTWSGYWKVARPVVTAFVQTCTVPMF
jgi:hypothetical protein